MPQAPNESRYENVAFRRCGHNGLDPPPVSPGTWQIFEEVNVFETARAIVRRVFDRDVTHFDLANMYGPSPENAEENFGKILRQDFFAMSRNELIISSKALKNLEFSAEELQRIERFAKESGVDLWREISLLWSGI